jgi:hypothetical protein
VDVEPDGVVTVWDEIACGCTEPAAGYPSVVVVADPDAGVETCDVMPAYRDIAAATLTAGDARDH